MVNDYIGIGTDEFKELIKNILGDEKIDVYLSIINLFDMVGYNEYLEDVDAVVNDQDAVDSDPSTLVDNLTYVLKEHSAKYIKRYGLILNEDMIQIPGLSFYFSLVNGLINIKSMDISQAVYIDSILNSDEINENTETLFEIIKVFEPLLDINHYFNLVLDVYDELFNRIENIVKDMLSKIDTNIVDYDIERLTDAIIELINIFVNNNLPTPSVIVSIINNPVSIYDCISSGCSKSFKLLLTEYIRTSTNLDLNDPVLKEDTYNSLNDIITNIFVTNMLNGVSIEDTILELRDYIIDNTNKTLVDMFDVIVDNVSTSLKDINAYDKIRKIVRTIKGD